jgi:cold shock CspA family protein
MSGIMRSGSSGNNSSNNNNGGGGQQRRRSSRRPSNLNALPFEQGIICSLKDSFGFIHCAERPEEIFFHYSEVANCRPDELQVDTEVEFKVVGGTTTTTTPATTGNGGSGGDNDGGSIKRVAAYQIKALPTGTVVWETEEEAGRVYRGLVERAPRYDAPGRGGGGGAGSSKAYSTDGSIRVLLLPGDDVNNNDGITSSFNRKEEDEEDTAEENDKSKGPVVRLRAGEYSGAVSGGAGDGPNSGGNNNSNNNGGGNSNRLFRGDLVEFRILIDRRTQQKYARHITLIQSEKERSRIERERKLLESAVPEEGIIVSLNKGFGFVKSNKRREDIYFQYPHMIMPEGGGGGDEHEEFELKIGQEVKFLVVTETPSEGEGGGEQQPTNRQSKCSARQIECLPEGSVVFHTVVARGVKGMVTMAPQPPSPSNKGDDCREGKIRLHQALTDAAGCDESDEILVEEVLLHYSDAPGGVFTYQNHRNQLVSGLWVHEGDTLLFDVTKETVDGSYRAIPTLHTLSVGGGIEEPEPATSDNSILPSSDASRQAAIRMISPTIVGRAEGMIQTLKLDYGFIHFAERPIDVHFKMYDLFPDELQADIRKQMGIEGPVKLEPGVAVQFDICAHGNISHAGSGNRGRTGKGGNAIERENIRGQRIVLLPKSAMTLEKVIAQGVKGVVKAVDSKQLYAGVLDLEEEVHPMTLDERHPLVAQMLDAFLEESSTPKGRKTLVYRDTLSMKDDDIVVEMAQLKGQGALECSHIPIPGISPHPGRLCIRRVEQSSGGSASCEEQTLSGGKSNKTEIKKYKSLRFDKSNMVNELKEDVPPGIGDIVSLDIIYSRRSGNFKIQNLKTLERKPIEAGKPANLTSVEASGVGVVKDVVPKRNFGFVSVLDDNATRRELLFFHLPQDRKGGGLRKGDEVKFDIVMEGGKRIATNMKIVPKGTIPSAAPQNACFGYILLEPSHTSLADTPMRKAHSNLSSGSDKPANGRWTEAKDDGKKNSQSEMHEGGCILLLEDKTGMFQKKSSSRRRRKAGHSQAHENGVDSSDDISVDDTRSVDSAGGDTTDDELSGDEGASSDDTAGNNRIVTVLSHLAYKNGAIAIHGTGAGLSMDGSTNPRRGDLVSFVKGRKRDTVRDVRLVERQKATLQSGRLENIQRIDTEDGKNKGNAKFIASTEMGEEYDIELSEVVSCDAKILKEKESVEGILHGGRIFGICRTCDLYLTSKPTTTHKERPKINLTVKKNRGGTIMAQSMMAKGPDGSNGFKNGWTKRTSAYAIGSV